MDPIYLSLLVHPIRKTALIYNAATNTLSDGGSDTFTVKENVPVLLVTETQEALLATDAHTQAGTSFNYKEHYQEDAVHYDYFEERNSAIERNEIHRLHQHILRSIPEKAEWVLDVGCGGGWLAKALQHKNKKVISMDISDINPRKAVKNVPYEGHFGLVADVFELPVKDNSVDCIVASEIIEHVSDPKRFLQALLNALKPGGRLIVTTPYNERIQMSLCIHCNKPTPHNAHLHSFTEQSIRRFLPQTASNVKTRIFNNKVAVRLGLERIFSFLPLPAWQLLDDAANALTKKRAYRLMMVAEK